MIGWVHVLVNRLQLDASRVLIKCAQRLLVLDIAIVGLVPVDTRKVNGLEAKIWFDFQVVVRILVRALLLVLELEQEKRRFF